MNLIVKYFGQGYQQNQAHLVKGFGNRAEEEGYFMERFSWIDLQLRHLYAQQLLIVVTWVREFCSRSGVGG